MANKKIQYRIRKGGSNSGEKGKPTAAQKGKYLLIVALLSAGGFGLYQYFAPDKYEYWNQLIAKDPKPQGVSEAEYREKLRAGYCWRDRKFYQAEELQQKAMISFSERLLGEAAAYRADATTTVNGPAYTSGDCRRSKTACRLWYIPQEYTNEQWDKLFLAEKDPKDGTLLAKYSEKEIKQSSELENYITQDKGRGFTLNKKSPADVSVIYGSDCCKTFSQKEAEPMIKNQTYVKDFGTFPENDIPKDIRIEDYGVGNFYLNVRKMIPGANQWDKSKEKSYQSDFSEIFFMNNCGDVLWQPYYIKID